MVIDPWSDAMPSKTLKGIVTRPVNPVSGINDHSPFDWTRWPPSLPLTSAMVRSSPESGSVAEGRIFTSAPIGAEMD